MADTYEQVVRYNCRKTQWKRIMPNPGYTLTLTLEAHIRCNRQLHATKERQVFTPVWLDKHTSTNSKVFSCHLGTMIGGVEFRTFALLIDSCFSLYTGLHMHLWGIATRICVPGIALPVLLQQGAFKRIVNRRWSRLRWIQPIYTSIQILSKSKSRAECGKNRQRECQSEPSGARLNPISHECARRCATQCSKKCQCERVFCVVCKLCELILPMTQDNVCLRVDKYNNQFVKCCIVFRVSICRVNESSEKF